MQIVSQIYSLNNVAQSLWSLECVESGVCGVWSMECVPNSHDCLAQGKLLYCHPPPGQDEWAFNQQLQLLPPDHTTPSHAQAQAQGSSPLGDEEGESPQSTTTPPNPPVKLGEFDSTYFRQVAILESMIKGQGSRP